jgi:mannose-6-phosphate isomerase-like protein (cupin superfamily)
MTGMLRLEDSGGVLALDDCEVPAGWEGAAADHGAADHGYYVIGGELTVRLGDEIANVRSGGFVFAPRGVPHSVANAGDAPARYVLIETPVQEAGPDLGPKLVEDVPGRVRVLLRGADSAGRIAVMDNVVPAGAKGPPLHHHDFDEAFYVLEGEATFQLGDALVTRRGGELVWAARGAHHAFANQSGADIRWLLICAPAGFERYFQRMAAEEAGVDPPPEALEPWPEVIVVGPRIGSDPAGV